MIDFFWQLLRSINRQMKVLAAERFLKERFWADFLLVYIYQVPIKRLCSRHVLAKPAVQL